MIDILESLRLAYGSWPSVPILRIPLPADKTTSDHSGRQPVRFAVGLEVADQHCVFTTATCIAALMQASAALTGVAPRIARQ